MTSFFAINLIGSILLSGNFVCEENVYNFVSEVVFNNENQKEMIDVCFEIENIDTGRKMHYFDFKGNNGYVLVDDNSVIYLIGEGDSPLSIGVGDKVYYSQFTIFKNDEKVSFKENLWEETFEIVGAPTNQPSYNYIEYNQLYSYLEEKYSDFDLEVETSNKLDYLLSTADYNGYNQEDESVYQKTEGNLIYFEGNCGIVSMANAIAYYSRTGDYPNLPRFSSITNINSLTDSVYNSAQNNNYFSRGEIISLHTIYNSVRNKAIGAGYVVNGMNDLMTERAYEETLQQYGYSGEFITMTNYTFEDIKVEIDNNRPVQLRVRNDEVYGNHGMLITGYKLFGGIGYINNMMCYANVPFVSVYDGHSSTERWYDISYLSNLDSSYNRASAQTIALLSIE